MMFFQVFTWQSFLIAAMVLSLVWYLGVGVLFYRAEILAFFSGKERKPVEPLPHGWADEVDELNGDLMGKVKQEHGVEVLEAEEFGFVPSEAGSGLADPLGDLADVQQEIKGVCRMLETEDGTKEDFFALFEVIRRKYPRVASSGLIAELNELIREHAPFALSEEELEGLWV